MKKGIVLGVAALIFSGVAFANTGATQARQEENKPTEEVVLVKRIGYLSESSPRNKKAECLVRRNHPELKKLIAHLDGMLDRMAQQSVQTAYHFVAQVPSVEIYATVKKDGKEEKILLVEDHSTLKTRQGDDAKKLIELVNKLCPSP